MPSNEDGQAPSGEQLPPIPGRADVIRRSGAASSIDETEEAYNMVTRERSRKTGTGELCPPEHDA